MYKTTAGTGLAGSGALAFTGFNAAICLVVAFGLIVLGTLLARLRFAGPMPRRRALHQPQVPLDPTS
jgi:hypothetical protein